MTLDESSVREALSTLQEKRLAGPASGADSRVTKFEHRLQEVFNFDRREIAVVCVLLLRGPQTPGELRGRTDRMYHFDALEDVVSTLDRLAQREHLFSGEPPEANVERTNVERENVERALPSTGSGQALPATPATSPTAERISALEQEVAALRTELSEVQQQLTAFRKQFE